MIYPPCFSNSKEICETPSEGRFRNEAELPKFLHFPSTQAPGGKMDVNSKGLFRDV
jgi:hypothetical protein